MSTNRQDYSRLVMWLMTKQGVRREARESQEQFVLRLFLRVMFDLFPEERRDLIRRRYRTKAQMKPGSFARLTWSTGGLKQGRTQKEPETMPFPFDDEEGKGID